MPTTSRATIIGFSLTALVLAALFGLGLYRIGVEHSRSMEYLRQASEREKEEQAFQSLRAIQTSAHDDLAAFDRAVFSPEKAVTLIDSLEKAGRSLGVTTDIASIDESTVTAQKGVRLTVDAEGSWQGVFAFFRAIENLPYRVVFEEATIAKSDDGGRWKDHFVLFLPAFK